MPEHFKSRYEICILAVNKNALFIYLTSKLKESYCRNIIKTFPASVREDEIIRYMHTCQGHCWVENDVNQKYPAMKGREQVTQKYSL